MSMDRHIEIASLYGAEANAAAIVALKFDDDVAAAIMERGLRCISALTNAAVDRMDYDDARKVFEAALYGHVRDIAFPATDGVDSGLEMWWAMTTDMVRRSYVASLEHIAKCIDTGDFRVCQCEACECMEQAIAMDDGDDAPEGNLSFIGEQPADTDVTVEVSVHMGD